jgi:hypothetical protein
VSEPSLTEALARHGITHEPCGNSGGRYLFWNSECIGVFDVAQGWALLKLIESLISTTD